MTCIIFNGTISIDTKEKKDKDEFLKDFNDFLNSRKAQFNGSLNIIDYEDVEIIDD